MKTKHCVYLIIKKANENKEVSKIHICQIFTLDLCICVAKICNDVELIIDRSLLFYEVATFNGALGTVQYLK